MTLRDYVCDKYLGGHQVLKESIEIRRKEVKRGEVVYAYGCKSDRLFFLSEGIVETKIILSEVEKTLSFIFENSFFGPYATCLSGESSDMQGEALTDCVVESFSFADYMRLCERSLLVNKISRVELSDYYLRKYRRERDLMTKNAEEMYKELVKHAPEILRNVPLKKIANYFGVLPETLSRIRKRMLS